MVVTATQLWHIRGKQWICTNLLLANNCYANMKILLRLPWLCRTKLTPNIITVTESHSYTTFTNNLAKTKGT